MKELVAHSMASMTLLAEPDHPATQRSPLLYVLYVLASMGVVLLVYVVVQSVRRNHKGN